VASFEPCASSSIAHERTLKVFVTMDRAIAVHFATMHVGIELVPGAIAACLHFRQLPDAVRRSPLSSGCVAQIAPM